MAVKKSDLYSSLWASCDELRAGMDANQYKDSVVFMLFIKYVGLLWAARVTSSRRRVDYRYGCRPYPARGLVILLASVTN